MTTETANALRAAKARIDTEDKWLRTRIGALLQGDVSARTALERQLPESCEPQIIARRLIWYYYDNATHADIMALFDRAIAAEEETP